MNIAISDECKAKSVAVNVTSPAAFGTFRFPAVVIERDVTVSIIGGADETRLDRIREEIARQMPEVYERARLIPETE